MQYHPSCAEAGVQFWSHLHGFKQGVAVQQHKEIEVCFGTVGLEVSLAAPLLLMAVHGQGQATRQVCRWSRALVVWGMPQVLAPVSKLD